MKQIKYLFIILIGMLTQGCSDPTITDDLLDGNVIFDPSLYNPEAYVVSAKYPNPTATDLEKPIIIAVHGYTATTFEWDEFKEWSTGSNYRISQVLLGGHGRDYNTFKNATWRDWKTPIMDEYEKLIALGYKNISLIGSSTGGTLLLELVSSGYFNNRIHPKNIFLIDPIVVPTSKTQSIAGIIGPMIVYVETDQTAAENNYWYRYKPQETINELNNVMLKVRKDLESGIVLPSGTYLKTFHSLHDPVASTTSSVLIYKGVKTSSGAKTEVQIMDSDIHVFTRLSLRTEVTSLQLANQNDAFIQISSKLK